MSDDGREVRSSAAVAYGIPVASSAGKLANGWLNTGTGNGLDADTVDGSHASAFSLAADEGAANGIATLDANSRLVEAAQTIRDAAGQNLTVNGTSDGTIVKRDGTALKAVVAEAFIDAPIGGGTVDTECRGAVDQIRALLIAHKLMAPS